jgi:short-subunit dehydrogenase
LSAAPRALVTGASSGIGEAFARALSARGHPLLLVARRRDRLEALARDLGASPEEAVLAADLQRPGAARAIGEEVARRGIEVDLLVNNAGLGHTARFHEQPADRIAAMLDVNLRALVELTHVFLPGLVHRRRGAVVNVASNAAFQPVPFLAVYAATKAFVLSFTEALATELRGTGVRVQALCPGLTRTEFLNLAETHTQGLRVDHLPTMTPEAVVAASLRALDGGAVRVVPGLANRSLATLQRFLPLSLVRNVAAALYRPRGGQTSAGH